ncbi:MAG: acetylornithine deacetylase [Castellaniella sp.]|uniref:acetylornithine deacetylase n=1 Tax=Castellaniella sp. TaxID=1955812 RepID=UPI003A887021
MNRTSTREWLRRLVAFDTTSRHSNLAMIETIRDALAAHGIASELTYAPAGNKANLFATLPAQDGATQGGIVLSGHTDVVPVDGQDWRSDPFALTERDGRLYGRGTADMKGFIAASLALVPHFLSLERRKSLHLAFSYDEEVGCLGAPVMLEALRRRGVRAEGCVVGEPTGMRVVVAHKGMNLYRCRVHGKAAHSSLTPHGCNAVEYAARLICRIRDLADQLRSEGPYDEAFDVPFTTMGTNLIAGGIAVNTIPDSCEFSYEFRNLPGLSPDDIQDRIDACIQTELLPRMRQEYDAARVEIDALPVVVPSLETAEHEAITRLARALTGDNAISKVSYGTEAGQFQNAGIPAVICGPGHIEQAHRADEFIDIAQLDACEGFLRKLADSLVDRP